MQRKNQESIYQQFNQCDKMLTKKNQSLSTSISVSQLKTLCLLPGNKEHEEWIRLKLENNEVVAHTLNKFKSLRLQELQPRLQKKWLMIWPKLYVLIL